MGSVMVPSRTSVPGRLPVAASSPLQSRMSSKTWKARPMRRPYSPRAPAASAAPESRAPRRAGGSEQVGGLALAAAHVGADADADVVRLGPLQHLALADRPTAVALRRRRRRRRPRPPAPRRRAPAGSCRRRRRPRTPYCVRDGRAAAPQLGAVEDVVVHERRHVQQLDRGRRRAAPARPRRTSARAQSSVSSGRTRLPPAARVARQASPSWPGVLGRHGRQALLDAVAGRARTRASAPSRPRSEGGTSGALRRAARRR